ncbi:Hypothetical protein PSEBR_m1730 [Pseudomonas brassicacearum subsp. brassicacearum NFM421]|uniref:Uncharacterized protein n=3 Tax=Pseudomonas brassicacearum TaxID=930166 RepID=F2K6Z7_PSEBN|nr:Hypothetical protein PSEBR_m1730 [Pseudomonas brassicacearum subsp. brassicacearum NFM421]
MDGPSRRAHGAIPSFRHAEPKRGTKWWGIKRFGYFRLGRLPGFSKVTRRKGGTLSRRYRNNGYAPKNNSGSELARDGGGSVDINAN